MTGKIRTTRWQIFRSGWKSNLEDTELHASAHSSQNSDSERPTYEATKLRKHCIETHFPKDRNCEVCLRTKTTRAPCRRRTGEALLCAEKFGHLMTADHKLSTRDLDQEAITGALSWYKISTHWIRTYPFKIKTSNETERSLSKFLEPSHKPKVTYTDKSLKFGKILWRSNMESQHFNASSMREKWHRWQSRSTIRRRYFSSGWWPDSMECCCHLRNVQDLLADGKNYVWKTIWRKILRANNSSWSNGWISSDFIETCINFGKNV